MAGVPGDGQQVPARPDDEIDVLADDSSQKPFKANHDIVDIDHVVFHSLSSREDEQLASEAGAVPGRSLDLGNILARGFIQARVRRQEARIVLDHAERVVEIVSKTFGKPGHSFHLLRMT